MQSVITLDNFFSRINNNENEVIKPTESFVVLDSETTTEECSTHFYARESTKKQADEGFNLEMQIKRGIEYCKYKGIKKCIIHKEKGKSAKTTNRNELNKLKEEIKKGKVKCVIIYKLDRLVRRLEGLSELIKLFRKYDVELISLCEEINTNTAVGRMLTNIIVSIAEWEQDTISERTNDGLIEGAEQGFYMLGGNKPFGYDKYEIGYHKQLKLNLEESRLLHKAKDLLKSGYSMFTIRMIINDDSYMKSIKKTYCENQLYKWLKNPILKGVMMLKGKAYKLDIESVFTELEFEELQNLIKERQKNSKYDYLFANKVRNNHGDLSSIKSTVKPNNVYLYYYDNETKNRVNENDIKSAVLEYFKKSNILYKSARQRTYDSDLRYIKAKHKSVKLMYENCEITTETYKNELLALEKEMKTINKLYIRYIKNLDTYFNNLSFAEQNKMIWNYIGYIEIDYTQKAIVKVS